MVHQNFQKCLLIFILLGFSLILYGQKGLKNVDATLDSTFGHFDIGEKPGISIAILEKDRPVVLKSYGHANLEYKIKNTPNTLFNAADLAKQFTVFSILILQDEGKLSLDDEIKKYLPALEKWPFNITLKHLVEQTSGLRDVMDLKNWTGYQNGDVISKREIIEVIAAQKQINFSPGSKREYNRTGFVLLTEVIAKVSGMPFSDFVQRHIFTPLEMNNSVFVNSHSELVPNRSYSYKNVDNKFTKVINNTSFVGGTNLYTSTADFAKWLSNMTNHAIGKPSFYAYMYTNTTLSNGEKTDYTPGIYKDNRSGYETIHLEGFDHGFSAYMMHIPDYDFSLVYFSNDMDIATDKLYDFIYSWFHEDYQISPLEPIKLHSVSLISKSKAELQAYIGSYLFEDNFNLRKVILDNDTLYYARNEENRTAMVPIDGNHSFKMLVPGSDNIRVSFSKQGEILAFRALNGSESNDFVTLGRKLKPINSAQIAFEAEFKNEEIDHHIAVRSINKGMQISIDDSLIDLEQVEEDGFLAESSPKIKYLKLERDENMNITGLFLYGLQIKNLYYKVVNK